MKYLFVLIWVFVIQTLSRYSLPLEIRQKLLDKGLELIQQYFQQSELVTQFSELKSNPVCSICHSVVKTIQNTPAKQVIKSLQAIAVEYCVLDKIQNREVCKGAIGYEAKYLLQSLWKKYIDPHSLCPKLKLCPKQYEILKSSDYVTSILKDKPEKSQQQPTRRKILNIAHISDIHPDFFYVPGKPTTCNEPLCCRYGVVGKPNAKLAGYWGSNEGDCDLPFQTFNLMLNELKDKSIDAIVWTGDNTAHDIWRQSEEYNANFTRVISDRIHDVLPKAVVLPAIGNHECFPVNIYEWDNEDDLNTHLGQSWRRWIGNDAVKTMKKNGYFSFRIDSLKLVAISLNTQAWSHENFALLSNPTDPGKQLQWMEGVLRKAEEDGDWVYILGHIPPNDGLNEYSERYNGLINRFSYTVRGQFYGHTHSDHISFFNKINSSQILNHCLIAPSLTTASNKNPNYRIMRVDQDTMRVLDYDQYALKLQNNYTQAEIPKFQITYSLLKEYEMTSFDFAEIEKFRQRLKEDPNTQIKYAFHRDGDLNPGKPDAKIYCDTFGSEKEVIQCREGKLNLSKFQKTAGPWRKLKQ